jgi:hypothetical protein
MRAYSRRKRGERGTILLVVVFIATAVAGLAAISAARVVTETKRQRSLEDETRAISSAYAQINMAMNVVNNAEYDLMNHNLELRAAIDGLYGGTASELQTVTTTEAPPSPGGEESGYLSEETKEGEEKVLEWLQDPDGTIKYGFIRGTNVRVYHARDYLKRLHRLKTGETSVPDFDPSSQSDGYFVLEAAGRSGGVVRLVSSLIRETQPFSAYVFFQNRGVLGISGAPKGLVHSNEKIAFYFPEGDYRDAVSAVDGFEWMAGAEPGNTLLKNANGAAKPINLEDVDFAELRAAADPDNPDSEHGLFVGPAGLDADIQMQTNGNVKIVLKTQPHFDTVTKTKWVADGQVPVEVPTYEWVDDLDRDPYKVKVFDHWEYSGGYVQVQVGTTQETYMATVPVYEWQTVTKYRSEKVWVSYSDTDAGGGTTVGGGGTGELGEWQWISVPYETQEQVQVGTTQVEKTRTVPVYEEQWSETATRTAVYRWEERYYKKQVETGTTTQWQTTYAEVEYEEEVFVGSRNVGVEQVALGMESGSTQLKKGVIYIDGRVRALDGNLLGRLTIVSTDTVRVTGDIQYVDPTGETAMLNGKNSSEPYVPNPAYWEDYREAYRSSPPVSVLGVIAKEDVVFAREMPSSSEINGSLMSVEGRVGIDGFWADDGSGELYKDWYKRSTDSYPTREKYLDPERQEKERAYDKDGFMKTRTFKYNSLRRLGGIISNNRVMETYVRADRKTGMSLVDAGFARGRMMFDMNLRFNPPPNFIEIPMPEVRSFLPIHIVREGED